MSISRACLFCRCFFNDVGVAVRLKNCRNVTIDSCVLPNIIDCGSSFETDGSANDITHQSGIHCRNGVENVLITSNLICRERAEEMRYGIHLRETTGTIKANLIVGVNETIHIPRSLVETVKIE